MGNLVLPIIIVAFIALLYFSAIRPQKRRQQQVQRILAALKPGDEVVTVAGIYGTVTEIEEGGTLLLEVAEDTEIRVSRAAIAGLADQVVAAPGAPKVPEVQRPAEPAREAEAPAGPDRAA